MDCVNKDALGLCWLKWEVIEASTMSVVEALLSTRLKIEACRFSVDVSLIEKSLPAFSVKGKYTKNR